MFVFPFGFSRTSDVENLAGCYLQPLSGWSSLAQSQGWIGDPDGTISIVVPVYYFASQYLLQFGLESTLPKRRFAFKRATK